MKNIEKPKSVSSKIFKFIKYSKNNQDGQIAALFGLHAGLTLSERTLEKSRDMVVQVLDHGGEHPSEWSFVNAKVRDTLYKYYYEQTKRRPMILPFMVKV